MPSAQRSITINRPINEVFAYVADGENGPKWRSGKIEVKHEAGEGVGAVYRADRARSSRAARQGGLRGDGLPVTEANGFQGDRRPRPPDWVLRPLVARRRQDQVDLFTRREGRAGQARSDDGPNGPEVDGRRDGLARQAQEGARGGATGKRGWRRRPSRLPRASRLRRPPSPHQSRRPNPPHGERRRNRVGAGAPKAK